MNDFLKALIPQGKNGLALWFIFFILSFGLYHFCGPYSIFESWYYDISRQPWHYENINKQQTDIAVAYIRIQRPVADFLESEVIITVQNMTTEIQTAVVGLNVITGTARTAPTKTPRVYIRTPLTDRTQDVVILEDIPPYGKVSAVFMVRIAEGEKGCEYPLRLIINGDFSPSIAPAFEYNPEERFRMWLVSLLLLPPGSGIALPVISMLFASWLESFCGVLKSKQLWESTKADNIHAKPTNKSGNFVLHIWPWFFVIIVAVLIVGLISPLNPLDAMYFGLFLLLTLIAHIVFGFLYIVFKYKANLSKKIEFTWLNWKAIQYAFSCTWPWLTMTVFLSYVLGIALPREIRGTWHIIFTFVGATLCCFCPCIYNFLGHESKTC
jgi:hypothetical protein